MKISLEEIGVLSEKNQSRLAEIFSGDIKLNVSLGSKIYNKISVEEFKKYNKEWIKKNHAELFAILKDEEAIGMISLSHKDLEKKTARIGYLLGSEYWNRGYASVAFEMTLEIARSEGLASVSGTIEKDNTASKRIWKKFGAIFNYEGDKAGAVINL